MAELGSNEFKKEFFEKRVDLIKQWDKKDAMEILLPQRIEDGKVLNFKGQVILSHDSDDHVFHELDAVQSITRVTSNSLNILMEPVEAFFDGKVKPSKDEVEEPEEEELDEDDMAIDLLAEVEKLIGKDKLKKAKKFLDEYEDHDDYKKAKKLIKKAGKDNE